MLTREEMRASLWERHTQEEYARLTQARVAVVGLGGLGSQVAIMLARCGVGTLHLIDYDVVDVSNLNRQAYRICHVGKRKVEALREELQSIQPYCLVLTTHVRVTSDNAEQVLADDMLIAEAFDDAKAKAMLVNTILTQTRDKTIVSASGLVGYASSNLIETKRIMPRFYVCGDGVSDLADGLPLMAPRVMICAGHQANMIVRLILGSEDV